MVHLFITSEAVVVRDEEVFDHKSYDELKFTIATYSGFTVPESRLSTVYENLRRHKQIKSLHGSNRPFLCIEATISDDCIEYNMQTGTPIVGRLFNLLNQILPRGIVITGVFHRVQQDVSSGDWGCLDFLKGDCARHGKPGFAPCSCDKVETSRFHIAPICVMCPSFNMNIKEVEDER